MSVMVEAYNNDKLKTIRKIIKTMQNVNVFCYSQSCIYGIDTTIILVYENK